MSKLEKLHQQLQEITIDWLDQSATPYMDRSRRVSAGVEDEGFPSDKGLMLEAHIELYNQHHPEHKISQPNPQNGDFLALCCGHAFAELRLAEYFGYQKKPNRTP